MSDARRQIRHADVGHAEAAADLAAGLAQSFTASPITLGRGHPAPLAADGACLLLTVNEHDRLSYLPGFCHPHLHANGPVA